MSDRSSPLIFAMVLFLASELMFFGGLFAAYFTIRSRTRAWPPPDVELKLLLPTLATILLVVSSGTAQRSLRRLEDGDVAGMRRWLWVTIGLAVAFLANQGHEYVEATFTIRSHAYGSLFYAMTGFHGLHVLVGLALMFVLLGRTAQGAYARTHEEPDLSGPVAIVYYWHFVDVVWVGLFTTLYVLR